jgi:glycerophosphoryl diester phosphodiesterase
VNRVVVHGHRGSRGTHPENIIPSFAEARDVGCEFVELDVHLTRDDRVVVFHDPEISGKLCRDASGKPVTSPIAINELTLAEIKTYEVGSQLLPGFPEQKATPGWRIPTLDELIEWKQREAPQMGLNIEIKRVATATGRLRSVEDIAAAVASVLRKDYFIETHLNSTLVQSFDHEVVSAVRKLMPLVRLSCLFEEKADFAKVANAHQAQVAAVHYPLLDAENVRHCHDMGIEVLPWTANDAVEWTRLIGLGVRSIITDYPRNLKEFLKTATTS